MEEIILNAMERTKQHGKFKEPGFIPGVLYGDDVEATSVKFEEADLRKILSKHGSNAKIWIKYADSKKFGFIKEIQRHPVTAKIIHIDVQLVSKNHEVKLQIPINYKGAEALIENQLYLQVYKTQIDVIGKMELMPEVVDIDVSAKGQGYSITIKDFSLDKSIRVTDADDAVYAAIGHVSEKPVEVTDETSESEPVVSAQ